MECGWTELLSLERDYRTRHSRATNQHPRTDSWQGHGGNRDCQPYQGEGRPCAKSWKPPTGSARRLKPSRWRWAKTFTAKPSSPDLAQMPHCLVAGTTGSGKSVCINSMIGSLLFRYTPEELRFIDRSIRKWSRCRCTTTCRIWSRPWSQILRRCSLALRWVVDDMELRYQIFAKSGVRNIASFNDRPLPRSSEQSDAEKIFGQRA